MCWERFEEREKEQVRSAEQERRVYELEREQAEEELAETKREEEELVPA